MTAFARCAKRAGKDLGRRPQNHLENHVWSISYRSNLNIVYEVLHFLSKNNAPTMTIAMKEKVEKMDFMMVKTEATSATEVTSEGYRMSIFTTAIFSK